MPEVSRERIAALVAKATEGGIPIVRPRQSPQAVAAAFGIAPEEHSRRVDWHPAYPMKRERKASGVGGRKAAKRWRKEWRAQT